MRRFEDLLVWQRAREMTKIITELTEGWANDAGLGNQMRRAVISIGSNICEGSARCTEADIRRFFVMARGSAGELRGQLCLAADCGRITAEQFYFTNNEVRQIDAMLRAFIERLGGM
jgi:four helix bundle protein